MDSTSCLGVMENCVQLFQQGQFIKCSTKLGKLNFREFSSLTLAQEQNILVCDVLLQLQSHTGRSALNQLNNPSTSTTSSTTSTTSRLSSYGILDSQAGFPVSNQETGAGHISGDDKSGYDRDADSGHDRTRRQISKCIQSLKNILCKIHGLPIMDPLLVIECVTTYNLIYLRMMERTLTKNAISSQDHDCVNKCLSRVNRLTNIEKVAEDSVEELGSSLLKSRLSAEVNGAITLLLVIYYLQRLTADMGDQSKYSDILYTIYRTVHHIKIPGHLISFPLLDTGENPRLNLEAMSFHLLCTSLYTEKKYIECEEVFKRDEQTNRLPETMYLRGCLFFKLKKYYECINELNTLCGANVSPRLKAMAECCVGSCMTKQGAIHSAIQHYKKSLKYDFTYTSALYNIAEQYRQISMHDAEMESLKMLIAIKELVPQAGGSPYVDITYLLTSAVEPFERKNLAEAVYHMSRRCFEIKRFDVAAERYLDLLSLLTSKDSIQSMDFHLEVDHLHESTLPSVSKIFIEAARALISSRRYEDAIAVCDQVITKYTHPGSKVSDMANELLQGSEQAPTSSLSSKKRKHSEENSVSKIVEDLDEIDVDIVGLKYKAEAFYYLGCLQDALDCIDRAISSIELNKIALPTPDKPPDRKKVRVDSEELVSNTNTTTSFVVSAYVLKGILLAKLKKPRSALTLLGCALQLKSDDLMVNFVRCLLLFDIGNDKEAVSCWSKFRDRNMNRIDTFQLESLLENKYSRFRNKEVHLPAFSFENPTEEQINALDVICLRRAQEISLQRGSPYPR